MNRVLKIAAVLACALLLSAGAVQRQTKPAAFCELCAARCETTEWQVRGTHWTLWRSEKTERTPMSELLTTRHLAVAHAHRWMAARSVPDPLNEFGPPVTESLEFVNTPRVVNFMRAVADYADPTSQAHWREMVLDPAYTYVMDGALRYLRVPETGFANRTEFLTWWGGNSYALYNRLREETEPD